MFERGLWIPPQSPLKHKKDKNMNQKPVTQFTSPCSKARIYVENDMPIGVFHDFVMHIKGLMVDRMVAAHNEQVSQACEAMKDLPKEDNLGDNSAQKEHQEKVE